MTWRWAAIGQALVTMPTNGDNHASVVDMLIFVSCLEIILFVVPTLSDRDRRRLLRRSRRHHHHHHHHHKRLFSSIVVTGSFGPGFRNVAFIPSRCPSR